MVGFHVNLVEDRLDVTDDVGVEAHTKDHPYDCYDSLIVSDSTDISIAYRCQCLKCPVHTRAILVASAIVKQVHSDNPRIWLKII